jgi:hypothetical protein
MSDSDPAEYRFRAHAFAKDRTFLLTDDALIWSEDGARIDGVYYDDIAEVRIAYAPTRVARNRYRTQVIFGHGGMVELFNTHYAGFADFEERNEAYAAFVRELHRRLAECNVPVIYRKGSSPAAYAGNLLLTVGSFGAIALAFVLLFNFGIVWIAVAKLAIILFFVPTLIRYLRRSRPETYDPLAIPGDALPAG